MEIGRIENVNLRLVWTNEATDFRPWLLANPDVLADALGIEVELEEAEHPVGGFSLDLRGRDLTNECVLIVENQIEQTDHTHLGQLLTYAGGVHDVGTAVWDALHADLREWFIATLERFVPAFAPEAVHGDGPG